MEEPKIFKFWFGYEMKKYQMQIIGLTSADVLMRIFDLALPFFQASSVYRVSANKYLSERSVEKAEVRERIKYLKKRGLIETFVENKEKYFEVTPKGIKEINKYLIENPQIIRPEKWDGKWRIVIFDIPEEDKNNRDLFRRRLIKIGFKEIQESVYVYPFECGEIVELQSQTIGVFENVLIMISEIMQGEDDIIDFFLDQKVLNNNDLKVIRAKKHI